MNGHLGKQHSSVTLERRCRCGNPSSRTTAIPRECLVPSETSQYAPGGSLAAPCIWPFLNRLQHPNTQTDS